MDPPFPVDPEEGLRLLAAEYSRMAPVYDARAVAHYRALAADLLSIAETGRGETVLEAGCGTGNLAFQAAERVGSGGSVLGIDLAPGMVRFACRKVLAGSGSPVRFLLMDARQLAFRGETCDVVASCLGIPALGHVRAFREAHRVLRQGGRFVFCVATGKGTPVPFQRLLEEYRASPPPPKVAELLEARRCIGETHEPAALRDPDRIGKVLREVGFQEVAIVTQVQRRVYPTPEDYVAYAAAWGDNERELAAMDPATRRGFDQEFEGRTASLRSEEGLVVEVEHRFHSARKL